MAFTDLFEQLDAICLDTFGVGATLFPQDGGEVDLTGIFAPPAMLEEVLPGRGGIVARFFVRLTDIDPYPQHGDTIAINDDVYDVAEVEADNAGGGVLKLRKKA